MHHYGTDTTAVEQPLLKAGRTSTSSSAIYGSQEGDLMRPQEYKTPLPSWTHARYDAQKRRMPQIISHRGYKMVYPENTMRSFQGAVEVGTHAIETDIHLSSDDIVVLSHDSDLKRCFGKKEKIIECDWQFLSQLRTLKSPHEPMPRLKDLLEYVARPEQRHIWVLLDIKLDNNAEKVMRLIAETISSVDSPTRAWSDRVVLGVWAAKYLSLCPKYLPGFPITHIGVSTCYARQFLKVPNISFNILQKVLLGPIGTRFIKDVKAAGRPIYVWTVNDVNMMKWSVQKQMDGVITDDPRMFKQVCDHWNDNEPEAKPNFFQWLYTFWLYMIIMIFTIPFKRKFPETVELYLKSRELAVAATSKIDG